MENNQKNKIGKNTDSLTAVSHHVKNPVYVLKSYLEALFAEDLGELNDSQKKYIKVCLESADKIRHIVESLVYAIEIEEGNYEMKKEKVDIVAIAESAIGNNSSIARASNTFIDFQVQERPLFVMTDKNKIEDVFSAFITNAIKYKEPGEGKVLIEIKKREGDIFCMVKDNGIGVPEEDKERIFNKFYRTKRGIEKDPNNLGLELYINRVVIEDCGGKIWVENNEEGGASFCFTLPREE